MSYVTTNIYRNPGPYYGTSDKGEPVPGWGPLPVMAGGDLVAVGQVVLPNRYTFDGRGPSYTRSSGEGSQLSMLYWTAVGAAALGFGLGYLSRTKRFGGRR